MYCRGSIAPLGTPLRRQWIRLLIWLVINGSDASRFVTFTFCSRRRVHRREPLASSALSIVPYSHSRPNINNILVVLSEILWEWRPKWTTTKRGKFELCISNHLKLFFMQEFSIDAFTGCRVYCVGSPFAYCSYFVFHISSQCFLDLELNSLSAQRKTSLTSAICIWFPWYARPTFFPHSNKRLGYVAFRERGIIRRCRSCLMFFSCTTRHS